MIIQDYHLHGLHLFRHAVNHHRQLTIVPPTASPAASPTHTAKFICTAPDAQGFARNQGFSHNAAGIGQNTTECMSGHPHHIGSLFLIQVFKITQPDGFQLFEGQQHLSADGHTPRDKRGNCRITGNKSGFFGSRHGISFSYFAHLSII
jgi:hypothetical protein